MVQRYLSKELRLIFDFAKPYKISFFALFFCVTVISSINIIYPYLLGIMLNEIIYHRNIYFFSVIGTVYFVLFIGERLMHFVQANIWIYLASKFLFDLRKKLFCKIIAAKADVLANGSSGEFISVINKDVNMIMDLIHMNIFHLFNIFLRFVLSIAFVYSISEKLVVLMIIITPTSLYISSYFSKKNKTLFSKCREQYGEFISWVYGILNGLTEIKILASEAVVKRHFAKKSLEILRLQYGTYYTEFLSERVNAFIILCSDVFLYALSGILIVKGELTVGGFVAAIEYFNKANIALKSLNEASARISNNMVSVRRIIQMLSVQTEVKKISHRNTEITQGKIEYINVAFGYGQDMILKNINITINPGEKIAIVGESGSGKSTFISLLTRFYDPVQGSVKIDGVEISKYSLNVVRKEIGVVQQNVLLLDGSIRYNITIANKKCKENEIWQACELAYAKDFINNCESGLDTDVGGDRKNLSGGQRQRLAIARIILKNPKILVFDEATAALDYEAEQAITSALDILSRDRTTIIIAHRLSTIVNADRIAVLHNGEFIAYDTHVDLIKKCSYYRKLFYSQYTDKKEFII